MILWTLILVFFIAMIARKFYLGDEQAAMKWMVGLIGFLIFTLLMPGPYVGMRD